MKNDEALLCSGTELVLDGVLCVLPDISVSIVNKILRFLHLQMSFVTYFKVKPFVVLKQRYKSSHGYKTSINVKRNSNWVAKQQLMPH